MALLKPTLTGWIRKRFFKNGQRLGRARRARIVVSCEPPEIAKGMGLSEPMAQAVDIALQVVHRLITSAMYEQRTNCE